MARCIDDIKLPSSARFASAGSAFLQFAIFLAGLTLTACQKGKSEHAPLPQPSVPTPEASPVDPQTSVPQGGSEVTIAWQISDDHSLVLNVDGGVMPEVRYSMAPEPLACSASSRNWHAQEDFAANLTGLIGGDYLLCLASEASAAFLPAASGVVTIPASIALLIDTDSGVLAYSGGPTDGLELSSLAIRHRASQSDGIAFFSDARGKWSRGWWNGVNWVESPLGESQHAVSVAPMGKRGFLSSVRVDDGTLQILNHKGVVFTSLGDAAIVSVPKHLGGGRLAASSDGNQLMIAESGQSRLGTFELPKTCPSLSDLKIAQVGSQITALVVCHEPEDPGCTLGLLRTQSDIDEDRLIFEVIERHEDHCDPFLQREILVDRGTAIAYYHRRSENGFSLFALRAFEEVGASQPVMLADQLVAAAFGFIFVHGSHEMVWVQQHEVRRMRWTLGKVESETIDISGLSTAHILASSNKIIKELL